MLFLPERHLAELVEFRFPRELIIDLFRCLFTLQSELILEN